MSQNLRVVLFIFFIQNCIAQSYIPLLNNSNQWHFTNCYFGCLTDIYFTNGDTIVNNKNYKVLDGYHYISRTFLLREEIENRKVFFMNANGINNPEYLLYDFSLNEGDSFNMQNPITPFPTNGGTFILDSIRSKPVVNNLQHRHFYFSPSPTNSVNNYNTVWIEGVGSKSLINAAGGNADINGVGHLSCYFKNDILTYSQLDSISSCNYQNLNIDNLHSNSLQTLELIYKNNSIYNLINSNDVDEIEIYDITGRKYLKLYHHDEQTIDIDLSNLNQGFYIILANNLNRKKSFKVLKK